MTVVLILFFICMLTWCASVFESMFSAKPSLYQFLAWLGYIVVLLTVLFFTGWLIWQRLS